MKIIKSRRKTLTLKVDKNGEAIIKAPYLTSQKTILDFVEKHKAWIEKRQNDVIWSKKHFVEWEKFFYLWKEYPLEFDLTSSKLGFDWEKFLLSRDFKEKVEKKFLEFYKYEAKDYIWNRLKYISKMNGLEYRDFRITSAKTRWGSCSSKRNLSFSFRLIFTPYEVIDYVIIHELAHLKQMNHSKKFRAEVEDTAKNIELDDYKSCKKWLREQGRKVDFI